MLTRRMIVLSAVILLCSPAMSVLGAEATEPPEVEVRIMVVHPEQMFDADPAKGKQQVKDLVGKIAGANFNLILPWTQSGYLAALEDAECRKDHPTAAWDALGMLIDEAGQRGIETHLWYSFTDYKTASSPEFNPRTKGNPQWAARRLDEFVPDSKTGKVVPRRMDCVCPQHPGARRWHIDTLSRALDRYPRVTGVHIEEPGYGYLGYCVCDLCREVFPKLHGTPMEKAVNTPEAEDFATMGTGAFMRDLRNMLLKRNPKLIFSTNGGYNWRGDRRLGRDWARWARNGWLDFYLTQIYLQQMDAYRQRLSVTLKDLKGDCEVYAVVAFKWSGGQNTVDTIVGQIEETRRLGVKGIGLFSAGSCTDELYERLRTGPFRKPAKLPNPPR